MSLNICIDCSFEKKRCQCVADIPEPIKISWWKKIINWFF
jgi:hypothetical protein